MMQIVAATTQDLRACLQLAQAPVEPNKPSVLMVMPCTDVPMARRAATLMAQRAGAPGTVLLVEDLSAWGFVHIVNHVFSATAAHNNADAYFGYVAQDAFAGRQWLALALRALATPGKNLLGFNDGKWQGAMASFGLARRSWAAGNYEAGRFFQSGYQSHYADAELTLLAMAANTYVYDPSSVLVEMDWDKDSAQVNPADRALYAQRAAEGFGGKVTRPELLKLFS
jgi:hypothetical protein